MVFVVCVCVSPFDFYVVSCFLVGVLLITHSAHLGLILVWLLKAPVSSNPVAQFVCSPMIQTRPAFMGFLSSKVHVGQVWKLTYYLLFRREKKHLGLIVQPSTPAKKIVTLQCSYC